MSFCVVVLLVNMCVCHLYNKLTYLLTYMPNHPHSFLPATKSYAPRCHDHSQASTTIPFHSFTLQMQTFLYTRRQHCFIKASRDSSAFWTGVQTGQLSAKDDGSVVSKGDSYGSTDLCGLRGWSDTNQVVSQHPSTVGKPSITSTISFH